MSNPKNGWLFSMKMHETCDFNEKERVKENYSSQKTKTLKDFRQKLAQIGSVKEEQIKECLKSLENYEEHMRKLFLKHSLTDFRLVEN